MDMQASAIGMCMIVAGLAACGAKVSPESDEDPFAEQGEVELSFTNSGNLCLLLGVGDWHETFTYPAATPVGVRIVPPADEMPGWCLKSVTGHCSERYGSGLVELTTEMSVIYSRGGGGALCGPIDPYTYAVSCVVAPLEPGEFELSHGGSRTRFVVGEPGGLERDDVYFSNPLFHCLRSTPATN